MDKLTLHFLHPRSNSVYVALVSPRCTTSIALSALTSQATSPFLAPQKANHAYALMLLRTEEIIPPLMTMEEAGVMDNDMIGIQFAFIDDASP